MSPVDQSLPGLPRWEQHPELVQWDLGVSSGTDSVREPAWQEICGGGRELDTSEASRMIRDLAAAGVLALALAWDGRALREDLGELLRLAARDGLGTWLESSKGVALEPQLAVRLSAAGLVGFSARIDTDAPELHDAASLASLRTARDAGLLLAVETRVDRENIARLPALLAVVAGLDVQRWHLRFPVRGKASMPSADEMDSALNQLADVEQTLPFMLELTAAPQFRRLRVMRGAPADGASRVLNDGRGLLFVSRCGDIFPSDELPVPCGNLRIHDLLDVYRFHPTFRALRDSSALKGSCSSCEYQHICGGSRARAYALEGSLLTGDVLCAHAPHRAARRTFP